MARTKGAKGGIYGNNIHKETFEGLCKIQCTTEEITSVLGCGYDTLLKWCRQEYGADLLECKKHFAEGGKASLRRIQWKHAEKNVQMAIWLGKNYLDQSDKVEQEVDTKIEIVNDVRNL